MKRIPHPKKFFTREEEFKIIQAIKEAEKDTSGEIRVHLTKEITKNPLREAVRIFNVLKMHKTKQRNGCLILIGLKNKKIAVIGDKGINAKAGEGFWDDVINLMADNFRKDDYVKGLTQAVLRIGEKLKRYFPYAQDDINELSDELSREDS